MEKAHVAAGGPFCGVRRRPKFIGVFTQFCPSPPQIGFLSVIGSPGFFQVCTECFLIRHIYVVMCIMMIFFAYEFIVCRSFVLCIIYSFIPDIYPHQICYG